MKSISIQEDSISIDNHTWRERNREEGVEKGASRD